MTLLFLAAMTAQGGFDDPSLQSVSIDAGLVSWLKNNAGKRTIRLPLQFKDSVGNEAVITRGKVRHELALDTGLMTNLDADIERHCREFPCTLWVDATWGPLIGEPPDGKEMAALRKVIKPVPCESEVIRIGDPTRGETTVKSIDRSMVEWLNTNAGKRTLQLPVFFDDSVGNVGTVKRGDVEYKIELDTSLMVNMDTDIERQCKHYPCALWVDATWGPLIGQPSADRPMAALRKIRLPVACESTVIGIR